MLDIITKRCQARFHGIIADEVVWAWTVGSLPRDVAKCPSLPMFTGEGLFGYPFSQTNETSCG